jgi:D-serine deaminase-like pyridoxal phosphate-dependent protein
MTWEGHCMGYADPAEREARIRESIALLLDTVEEAEAAGLTVSVVSAGGTGTYLTTAGIEGVTEVEAGGGIFGDVSYQRFDLQVKPALGVLCQVTSRPDGKKVIIDAGRKTIDPSACQPRVREFAVDGDIRFSAEHGTIRLPDDSDSPKVGDRIFLESGYSDQLVHLHERFIGVRNGIVEAVWPVLARGRLQ